MRPTDDEADEQAAWRDFVSRLAGHLAAQWPAMPERLGERYAGFVDLAVQHAATQRLTHAASVARYANLCFVWGPAFHDKPGFEWAQGMLAAPAQPEWSRVHQLLRRSLVELQRLPNARIEPQALAAADAQVVAAFGALGRQGAMRQAEPAPLPQLACDLEAADLRLLDDGRLHEYRLDGGDWTRAPAASPPPLRIDAAHPAPALIALLSHQAGHAAPARLQLRVRAQALCDADVHPALSFDGPHGRWRWAGHETRAVNWPVATRQQPPAPAGAGSAIAEETSPELYRLEIETCGLRDEGDALGAQRMRVSAWPAEQSWLELQRAAPAQQALLPGTANWLPAGTRCRVERDGAALDAAPLRRQFEGGLDAAAAAGLQSLAQAWQSIPGLTAPRFDALLGLLVGKAAATWGWRFGAGGLDGPALMRLVAALDMQACAAEFVLGGEFAIAGTRSRLTLRAAAAVPLRAELRRESAAAPLADAMKAAAVTWRLPLAVTVDAIAGDSGALLRQVGVPAGALVGEAGLRPSTHGGSGWEWFAGLRIEAVAVLLEVADPLLGQRQFEQALLPELTLVDWSLG